MSKPTTIEEAIGAFIALKFDVDTDEFSDGTLVRWSDMLATIEQLVLERVIGEDELVVSDKGTEHYRNILRAEQRQALKQILRGKS